MYTTVLGASCDSRLYGTPYQQEIYDILEVHSGQDDLCLVMGESGTGKTAIKEEIRKKASKRMTVISVARTLHTYTNTIKIL